MYCSLYSKLLINNLIVNFWDFISLVFTSDNLRFTRLIIKIKISKVISVIIDILSYLELLLVSKMYSCAYFVMTLLTILYLNM